ncbi:MAG: hypothetical protein M1839_001941 [Geoglossum umbratile]|nr:MAG: hypothetical protein M1839_001941 [Geoglossum umbratile]
MEKPPGLGDRQVKVVPLTVVSFTDAVHKKPSRADLDSGPIVIDLLGDTPRPASRFLQSKPKRGTNVEIVLSDDSDDVSDMAEGRQKHSKGRPSPASAMKAVRIPRSIVLTSPIAPAFPSRVRRVREAPALFNNDHEDLAVLSDLTDASQPRVNMDTKFSDRTAVLLAALKGSSSRSRDGGGRSRLASDANIGPAPENHIPLSKKRKEGGSESHTNPAHTLATPPKKARKGKLTSAEKQDRAEEKERARVIREANKKIEKASREKLKELRALEKETASELASANRLRIDKRISTPEMIVDLPHSLEGSAVGDQIQSFLKNIQVEVGFTAPSPVPNVISWRRKVAARYNEDLGHWEPIQEEIKDEKHVMCLVPVKEFVNMAQTGPNDLDGTDVDTHVLRLKSRFEGCSPIYLIEGLGAWVRKNENVRNRAFQAAVLYQGDEIGGQGDSQITGSRRRKPAQQYVDADVIEDALLRLQVVHKCLIHHTVTAVETAEWVSNFTQHISTIPYRSQRMDLEASFCMEAGQVKTGEDKNDTYIKMLQEIVRVTAPVAYGIAAEHPDVPTLMNAFRERGATALQDLKKTANKNGAFTNNNIGQAISKRVYKIFMGEDPGSNEV